MRTTDISLTDLPVHDSQEAEAKARESFASALAKNNIPTGEQDKESLEDEGAGEAGAGEAAKGEPGGEDDHAKTGDDAKGEGDSEALTAAKKALTRYGMTPEMIGKLSEDDVLKLGKQFGKIQSDNDALRAGGDKAKAKEDDAGAGDAGAAGDTPGDDFVLPDAVTDELGPEASEPLTKAVNAYVRGQIAKVEKAAKDNLAAFSKTVKHLESLLEHELAIQARARLSTEVPEILDDEAFGSVIERMKVLSKGDKKFKTIDALMREAAIGTLGASVKDRLSNKNNARARDAGQPRPPNRNSDGKFAQDGDTAARQQFNRALERHGIRR